MEHIITSIKGPVLALASKFAAKQEDTTSSVLYQFTVVKQDNYVKDETVTNEKVQEIIDNEHKIFETIQSNNVLFKDEQLNEEKIEKDI